MRLFKVSLEYLYSWGSDSDEKKAERLRKLEARDQLLQQLGIQCPHSQRDTWLEHPTGLLVNDVQLLELTVSGNKPDIHEEVPVPYGDVSNLPDAVKKLTRLVNKLLHSPMADPRAGHVFNDHVQVHVPGPALVSYNEVNLMEDACSDALQYSLDQGWRIIAVCPQSQRRPDYILGRFNPDRDPGTHAKRGDR